MEKQDQPKEQQQQALAEIMKHASDLRRRSVEVNGKLDELRARAGRFIHPSEIVEKPKKP